jgi:hypothetical protein
MMKDQLRPAVGAPDWTSDQRMDLQMEELLSAHPALYGLEPFYIDWELIWPM